MDGLHTLKNMQMIIQNNEILKLQKELEKKNKEIERLKKEKKFLILHLVLFSDEKIVAELLKEIDKF